MKRKSLCIKILSKIYREKKKYENGSTTIFVMFVIGTLITLSVMLVTLTKDKLAVSKMDALASLSGRSVLSMYDIPLKENYGIFAINKTNNEIVEDMRVFLNENGMSNRVEDINVYAYKYSLINPDVFKNEICEYYKFMLAQNLLNQDTDNGSRNFGTTGKVLRNKNIINMLPSQSVDDTEIDKTSFADVLNNLNIDTLKDYVNDKVVVNEYAMNMFGNQTKAKDENTFFKNEVEYILAGKFDDDANYQKVKNIILLARNVVNLATIYKEPTLLATLEGISLTTGPVAGLTQAIVAESWALAESENDVAILEHGGKLPLVKNAQSWCLDIESALSGAADGYIDNHVTNGMDYEDYLRVMLYIKSEDIKLYRMMDLIQINIQGAYDKTFLIKTANVGFEEVLKINAGTYKYDEMY